MKFLNNLLVRFTMLLPKSFVYLFAKKYVAGETLDDAVKAVKDLNDKGIVATMDVLGEAIKTKEEAVETKNECFRILDVIEKEKLNANLSIKPTSLAMGIDNDFCFDLIKEIAEKAKSYNNFLRIDMEDSPYTDITFDMYRRIREEVGNVGIVVQSYLRRTVDDVKKLNAEGSHYRLCKGIYVEPEEIAYKGRQEVRDSYMESLGHMLDNGNYVGIATHDDYLIDESYKMLAEKNIAKDKYEFQMLYGVTEYKRDKINKDGHLMRIYVPYGEQWYAYSMRRLQENPNMAWYIVKSLFTFK